MPPPNFEGPSNLALFPPNMEPMFKNNYVSSNMARMWHQGCSSSYTTSGKIIENMYLWATETHFKFLRIFINKQAGEPKTSLILDE